MVVYVSCRVGHPRVASLAALSQFTFCPHLPYDMGKSINFTPALQSAAQSKKEAPETGASLRLL